MTSLTKLTDCLPEDWQSGTFIGRIALDEGPAPLLIVGETAYDMSQSAPTVAALIDRGDFSGAGGRPLGSPSVLEVPLLSPVDLQCVKACGVTFASSAVERVIEEKAQGDPHAAHRIRERLEAQIGASIRSVSPGSEAARSLKQALIGDGLWSQYLEVAIGPDAEVFTKAPVLATVGTAHEIGIRSDSDWNNPEPEIVLIIDGYGSPVGATLGNDVNLRDFEGRSALLLGKAKDNNASCAIGPLIRLFDHGFTMDDVREADVDLVIDGPDGYRLDGRSSMDQISRDPIELVRQALSEHQYPDGFALFLGTLFAPTQDRDAPGRGFTHKVGDVVTISSPRLGRLVNRVTTSRDAPPWTVGVGALFANLGRRGLLG